MTAYEQFGLLCLIMSLTADVHEPKDDWGLGKSIIELIRLLTTLFMFIYGTAAFAIPTVIKLIEAP